MNVNKAAIQHNAIKDSFSMSCFLSQNKLQLGNW